MPRVPVTGAGGFVGRALVGDLLAEGWDVVALVRRETDLGPRVDVRQVSDAAQAVENDRALVGADKIVHLGARVHRSGETGDEFLHDYVADKTTTTARVARAAASTG